MKVTRKSILALGISLVLLCAAVGEWGEANAHSQYSRPDQTGLAQTADAYFDWRAQGMVTPVRNQRGCAAGWAFTAAAMLESAVARETGRKVDLSEQYLLNCGGLEQPCAGGGWGALDLFAASYFPPQTMPGAVLESSLRYRGSAAACARAYPHPYRIDRWGTVNPEGASVEEIKQALLDYGPLGTSICAGPVFQSLARGYYRADESTTCDRQGQASNHAVLITGWDDLNNCWWVKNSWGTGWGQGGYACVSYGASRIGQDAVYLVYRAVPGLPVLSAPANGAVVKTLATALSWKALPGRADGYQVQVARDAGFTDRVLEAETTASPLVPAAELPPDARLYWRVRAWRGPIDEILLGPWSAVRSFKTPPETPVPLEPAGITVDGPRPVFRWSAAAGQRVEIQIARTPTCGRVWKTASSITGSYTPGSNLPRGAALYWRARARGKYTLSPWSPCVPFWTP